MDALELFKWASPGIPLTFFWKDDRICYNQRFLITYKVTDMFKSRKVNIYPFLVTFDIWN